MKYEFRELMFFYRLRILNLLRCLHFILNLGDERSDMRQNLNRKFVTILQVSIWFTSHTNSSGRTRENNRPRGQCSTLR